MRPRIHPEPAADHHLSEIEMWAISEGTSALLIDLAVLEPCRVLGVVERLRIDPLEGVIQLTITDGTGEAIARWPIGRSDRHKNFVPGTAVALEGMATQVLDGLPLLDEPQLTVIQQKAA
jgi:hypothetical protein